MFCLQSLECPGTRRSAPWGTRWCHRLDLIAGQVSPSFQLGTRQAPSRSCCQSRPSVSVPALAALSLQLGVGGLPRGGSSSRAAWALAVPPTWTSSRLPSCFPSQPPLPVTPMAGAPKAACNDVLRTGSLRTAWRVPAVLISVPCSRRDCTEWGSCSALQGEWVSETCLELGEMCRADSLQMCRVDVWKSGFLLNRSPRFGGSVYSLEHLAGGRP